MKTQRLKSVARSAALLCATALGTTALASWQEWTAAGGEGYWDVAGNWTLGGDGDVTDWRIGNGPDLENGGYSALTVKFSKAETISNATPLYIYGLPTTFTADNATAGLTSETLVLHPGWGWGGALTLGTGTYTFNSIEANEALTLNGGTLVLNGDVTGSGSLAVGENGGTIEVAGDNDRTISTALTGSGTLTKTGSRELWLTGDVSGFTGKITVAEGEGVGSVYVGQTEIKAGETFNLTTFYWTGAEDNVWSNVNNWLVGGVVPTAPPSITDIVEFSTDATVSFGETAANAYDVTISGSVTFGAGQINLRHEIKGEGTLRLAGTTVAHSAEANYNTLTISCPVEMVEGTDSILTGLASGTRLNTLYFTVSGNISGSGSFQARIRDCRYVNKAYYTFSGNNSAFTGTADLVPTARSGQTGAYVVFSTKDAAFPKATVKLMNRAVKDTGNRDHLGGVYYNGTVFASAGEYSFGSLDATLQSAAMASDVSLSVGSLEDSSISGYIGGTVRKVGADSTLELTLSETAGTVEAKEGTTVLKGTVAPASLDFTGTGATIKIATTVGTYETQTIVDEPAVEDDPTTTDVDESTPAVTHEETVQTAGFAPGLSTELANCQIAADTTTEEGYTIYTLAKVATAGETQYYTIADAIEALDEAEDKTVTLIRDTTEAVVIPAVGYTLVMGDFTAGSVAGAPGVAVKYNAETGTYTTVDNSSAKWTGAVNNWWHEAGNWDTGYVPDEGTDVTFENTATVWIYDYSGDNGNSLHKCKDINIGKCTVTLRFPNNGTSTQANTWPRLDVYGDITGTDSKTNLKLFRCGIRNMKGSGIGISKCHVVFENDGEHDSWLEGGDFNFNDFGVSGTGFLRLLGGTYTFRGGNFSGLDIPEGSKIEVTSVPVFSHATEFLTGAGRVIIGALPGTRFGDALKNGERWTGTCELNGINFGNTAIDAAHYGNANSTVCFNGVSGYLRAGEGVEVGNVKTIEIGANGLTLNNQYTAGAVKNYLIKADLTGTGAIKFGTKHQLSDKSKYVFTGDVSGFTGAINYGDLGSYRACVYFADSSITTSDFGSLTAPTDWGQIIVEEGKTVNVAATWFGAGGWIINGTVNVASTGALTCDSNGQLIGGSGTVRFAAAPATAPMLSSSAWTGVAVADFALTSGANCQLNSLGTANSVVANGQAFTGHLNGNYVMVPALRLDNDFTFNNGSSSTTAWPEGKITKFARILGDKNLNITWDNPNTGAVAYYEVEKIDGSYTGTINVSAKSALRVDEVALSAEPEVGVRLASIAVTSGGALVNAGTESVLDGAAVALTVGGASSDAVAVYDTDGLYLAVASVDVTTTPDEGEPVTTTTLFATYEAAAAFANENNVTEFAVLYGDGAVNGWDYNSETGKLTKNETAIARIGTTQYDTLEAAFAVATADDTVVLFGTSDENVTVGEGQTLVVEGAYTGTLSGLGTVDAKVVTTPAGFSSWTGTFVLDWDTSAATDSTAWELNNYGVSGSTVVIAQPIAKGYINAPVSGSNLHNVAPAVYLKANVLITNGFATNPEAENPVDQTTTFSQLGADEGVTFSFRYLSSAARKDTTLYAITKLKDFAGSFVLNAYNQVTIESVELDAIPEFGTKVVNVTSAASTASITATATVGEDSYLLALGDGGLYRATASVDGVGYLTLSAAIAAANGGKTVTLLADTTDGYTLAAGDSFSIAWNGHTTGEIVKPTGDFYNTESYDEETDTTAYTCTAAIGILTVGQTVTPVATADAAFIGFMAQTTTAGSTLRFFTENPLAQLSVPCATYDTETLTYTKLAAVAQIGTGAAAIQYPTLAEACTAAEQYKYDTVTLLVALGEQTVPDGWDYNDPETSETDFGTLTKEMTVTYNVSFVDTDGSSVLSPMQTVESGSVATKPAEDPVKVGKVFVAWTLGGTAYDFTTPVTADITLIASWEDAPTVITVDTDGCNFKVDATTAAAITEATGVATDSENFGKAAIAYVVGGVLDKVAGEVVLPTPTITVVNGKATVVYSGNNPQTTGYTVTCKLWSFALADANDSTKWGDPVATGAIGANLVDANASGASKFYKVTVSVEDAE